MREYSIWQVGAHLCGVLLVSLFLLPSLAWSSLRVGNAELQIFSAQQHAFQYDDGEYGMNWVQFRNELTAKQGIRVNSVCPGVIQTPLTAPVMKSNPQMAEAMVAMEPVGRLGKPEEIAESVVWLCSDAASFVTGLPMVVDGGIMAQ